MQKLDFESAIPPPLKLKVIFKTFLTRRHQFNRRAPFDKLIIGNDQRAWCQLVGTTRHFQYVILDEWSQIFEQFLLIFKIIF